MAKEKTKKSFYQYKLRKNDLNAVLVFDHKDKHPVGSTIELDVRDKDGKLIIGGEWTFVEEYKRYLITIEE